MGYKEFAARWNDPQDKVMQHIKAAKLVKSFDSNGIVLNTRRPEDEQEVQGEPDNKNVLDQTAKAAAKRP